MFLLGLIIGVIMGFVWGISGQLYLEKRYVDTGVAKIYGDYYTIRPLVPKEENNNVI